MTIPVKIECDCGQHYAFDVEPENGRMPFAVTCPGCGADGTAIANDIIARELSAHPPASPIRLVEPPPTPVKPPNPPGLRLAGKANEPVVPITIPARVTPAIPPVISPAPASVSSVTAARLSKLNEIDPEQLKHEARAKILWGDPPEEVTKFLMMKGLSYAEAATLTQEFFQERVATIRANGTRKIIIGSVLICVPIAAFAGSIRMGFLSIKIMGVLIAIGMYGAWLAINGILMVVAPKSEQGDASEGD